MNNPTQGMHHHNPFIPQPSMDPMMIMLMFMLMSPGGFGDNMMFMLLMCMMMK